MKPARACWAASLMILAFAALQAMTLDYGTWVNDLPHVRDYKVSSDIGRDSALDRDRVVEADQRPESLDRGMMRFKLYSTEADEVVNLIALARIRPGQMQFDPGFYQYGGAYLYPLGAWYLALSKLGVVQVAPLDRMLANPDAMDRVWIAGRAFVLLAFLASAVLLWMALRVVAPPGVALACLAIYLFCPAAIMFSQVMKPHWYALLWVNAALLIVARAAVRERLPVLPEVMLGIAIGFAVGSAMTFALFAVLMWLALVYLVMRGTVHVTTLARVPVVAIVAFVATNPYYLLNWRAVQAERAATQDWFQAALTPKAVFDFFQVSLLSGPGIALTLLTLALILWRLLRGPLPARLMALAVAAPVLVVAVLTANQAFWNVNFRYVSYVIPAAMIFLAAWPWRRQAIVLALCAVATAAQAVPMKLAYVDENSDVHSTRGNAAAWIDTNVPVGAGICVGTRTLAPYDVPPFHFDRYRINAPDCPWLVQVERHPRAVPLTPGYALKMRFTPRLSPQAFPLVWEHVNPQISIYRKDG